MPYDFVVIDPLDSVMPVSGLGESHWIECAEMLERLFDFSRDFHGNEERGRGMLILGTAQFNSKARREIEKVQQKNEGPDKYYDDLEALMKQDSFIQYFTTIGQKCDLAIGVCPYIKNGSRGMLIQGRQRDGGNFNSLEFQIDENSNLMIEAEDGFLVKRVNPEQLVQERIMPLDSYDEGL